MLGFALAALGFSISSVVALPVSSLAVLALAVVAAAFVNQYQFRLPSTQIAIPTASLFTFWGIFWLGPGGAILLGAAALAVGYIGMRNENGPGVFTVFTGIISSAASAIVFYLIFGNLAPGETETANIDPTMQV